MRAAIDADGTGLLLSIAVPAGDNRSFFDAANFESALDFFNLMSYDFHGGSFEGEMNGPLRSQTPIVDCTTRADGSRVDIDTALQEFLNQGVPVYKINLGLATYGRTWSIDSAGG